MVNQDLCACMCTAPRGNIMPDMNAMPCAMLVMQRQPWERAHARAPEARLSVLPTEVGVLEGVSSA